MADNQRLHKYNRNIYGWNNLKCCEVNKNNILKKWKQWKDYEYGLKTKLVLPTTFLTKKKA